LTTSSSGFSDMDLQVVTKPTEEPVSLDEAKDHLCIEGDDDNGQIQRKLKAATEAVSRMISGNRQLMAATYDMRLPEFPDRIVCPRPPLSSVTSINYVDTDGNTQTLSSTAYSVFTADDTPGYIDPAYSEVWPSTRNVANAVTVRFVAGSTTPDDVPAPIKEGILLKLESLFDPDKLPPAAANRAIKSLISPYRYGHYS
jgi:uncharacterized phiE125 gp8 family phage protein